MFFSRIYFFEKKFTFSLSKHIFFVITFHIFDLRKCAQILFSATKLRNNTKKREIGIVCPECNKETLVEDVGDSGASASDDEKSLLSQLPTNVDLAQRVQGCCFAFWKGKKTFLCFLSFFGFFSPRKKIQSCLLSSPLLALSPLALSFSLPSHSFSFFHSLVYPQFFFWDSIISLSLS